MDDVSAMLNAEQSVAQDLVEAFGRRIAARPSLAAARRVLRQLRTGQHAIDRQVRDLAEVVFRLALVKSYLRTGHPAQDSVYQARN
jgi:hypothetical protein